MVNDGSFAEVARMIGRVEAKVDRIDEKQDTLTVTVAQDSVRIGALEKARADDQQERAQIRSEERIERASNRTQARAALWTALGGIVLTIASYFVHLH